MTVERDWDRSFLANAKGSGATRDRAFQTWRAVREFAKEKKWDLAPGTITPKQARLYFEHRAKSISARSVQNEASHIRRAIAGAGRDLGDVKDSKNSWSSARLSVPEGSRLGGKAAADLSRFDSMKEKIPVDVHAVVGLCRDLGLRMKEAVMSGSSLSHWQKELEAKESLRRGADLRVDDGTKGGRGRFLFVPPHRVEAVLKSVEAAKECASSNSRGHVVLVDRDQGLKEAIKRVGNCLYRLDLRENDSAHGLRRAFAQRQYADYREAGFNESEALKKLSRDLGHGDGRGRWVSNNYLSGGSGGTA